MEKRLYRSTTDKRLGGVCGGIAEYFNVDSTLVRAAFILFALAGGPGLFLYIILYFIMPESLSASRKLKNDEF